MFHKQTWPKFSLFLNWIEANFQWKSGDLQKKKGLLAEIKNSNGFSGQKQVISKNEKKKVIAGIRRLFLAEIKNLNDFSGQKQVI